MTRSMVSTLLAIGLSLSVLPTGASAAEAAKAQPGPVRAALFGMHVAEPEPWPVVRVGSVRLWDTATTWRHVETAPGIYDFGRLDGFVAQARRHHARVTVVLGQTPSFHVAATARPALGYEHLGQDASRMPALPAWRGYVRAVASRYAGRVAALQVWNEANIPGFWSGTPRSMAVLTDAARRVIDRVNRARGTHLRLVSPSFVARTNTLPMDRYWKQRVHGRTMNQLVDAVALSLYPPTDLGPEAAIRRLAFLRRAILDRRGVTKPVWTTEVNYGLAPGGTTDPVHELSPRRQAAFVARTYLLQAAAGVRRIFWYGWTQRGNVSTVLSVGGEPTAAGRALARVQRWMIGSEMMGCNRVRSGVRRGLRVCTLRDEHGLKRVLWHPTRRVRLHLDGSAKWVIQLDGSVTAVSGAPAMVDYQPLMVRYRP